MSPLLSFSVFINERLISVAAEIFGAFEKTVAKYQEENNHLRTLLNIPPELQLCEIDSLQFSLSVAEGKVPTEQQHCEQEWSPSLGQEDPEPPQIKEEQEELWTSQEEEQLQGPLDTKDLILTSPCVKSECDQENPLWSSTLPQTQTEENRESESKPVDLKPSDTVSQLKDFDLPCDPQDNQNNQKADLRRDPGRFDQSPTLDLSPLPNTRSEICSSCNKIYSTCNVKADVRHSQLEKLCSICSKTFEYKGNSSKNPKTHTKENSYGFGECEKSFNWTYDLRRHIMIHTGEKPFSCTDCGKSFSRKRDLRRHIQNHTGITQKPYSCSECGKSFRYMAGLNTHKRIHTGEKPYSCGDCGKCFRQKGTLKTHTLTHTREKPFSCGDWKKL